MERKINLQKRDYVSKEKTYTQYRINIPLKFVRRLGWNEKDPQKLQMKFKKSKDKKFLQVQVED
ncbi:MAG: hypothetical protein OEL84_01815 [Nitrosopumilus sp.]|nr:hypothetical protein [Nitrosopumilus sp.]